VKSGAWSPTPIGALRAVPGGLPDSAATSGFIAKAMSPIRIKLQTRGITRSTIDAA
jgi:hypothetical protein